MSNCTYGKTLSDYPVSNLQDNDQIGLVASRIRCVFGRVGSTLSHRHRFVHTGIWEPVYGRDWSPWAKIPFTEWRISGIGTIESGDALTLSNVETSERISLALTKCLFKAILTSDTNGVQRKLRTGDSATSGTE